MWVCWMRTTQTEIFHTTLPVKGISHEIFGFLFMSINVYAVEPMIVFQFAFLLQYFILKLVCLTWLMQKSIRLILFIKASGDFLPFAVKSSRSLFALW
jgi:hypothetical protein